MGILSKFGSRRRGSSEGGSRLKLYATDDRQPADDVEDVALSAINEEIEIEEKVPGEVGATDQKEVDGLVMLAPIELELAQSEMEHEVERSGSMSSLPDGWREVDENKWSGELLEAMDWKLFEDLCAELFRRRGYAAETTGSGPDGGIDIVAHRDGAVEGKGIAVQCKRYSYPVPAKAVREFYGAARDGHEELIFITSNVFNEVAQEEFGEHPRIKLVEGTALLRLIERLGSDVAEELLEMVVTQDGGWQTATCPECDVKMTFCTARKSGRRFWGCVNYPTKRCFKRIYLKS